MIFLGAGASAPFGINTSNELTKIMREKIETKNPELLDAMDNFYRGVVRVEPDFEMYLTQLTALTDSTQVVSTHHSLIFSRQNPEYEGNYTEIINEMYQEVCQTCNAPFIQGTDKYLEPNNIEDIFSKTYDALFGVPLEYLKTRNILIFSTNYDPSIEIWCQKRNISCLDGTKSINNPEVKNKISIDNHIEQLETFYPQFSDNHIGLVRLHGSVWTYERNTVGELLKFNRPYDRLAFPDLYEIIRSKFPLLIFPGQEDYLRIGRWDKYYQFFKKYLSENCLFIGYSFRHQVINEQIRSSLETGKLKNIGIFAPDPDKLIQNLFQGRSYPEKKVVKIEGYFGTDEGIWELNRKWFGTYFRQSYDYANQLLDNAKQWKNETKKQYI